MNLKEIETAMAAGQERLALHRRYSSFAKEQVPPFGYFQMDMFECPPFVMFANNDTPVVDYILANGTFEPFSMSLWCRLAKTATGILDIGANVGIYSIAAAKLRPDLEVHAFEPNPYAFARLRVNKFANDLPNIVEHTTAVGPEAGVTKMQWYVKPFGNISSGGGLSMTKNERSETAVVSVEPLDGTGLARTLGTRPLVKIDVEGAEVIVLLAMKEILALRPDIILETFSQQSCDYINALLLPRGYSVYAIHENSSMVTRKLALTPCDPLDRAHDFNHLLTARPPSEIKSLIRGE